MGTNTMRNVDTGKRLRDNFLRNALFLVRYSNDLPIVGKTPIGIKSTPAHKGE